MKKQILAIIALVVVVVIVVIAFVARNGTAQDQSWGDASTDPQKLMIPRWFLSELTLNGETIALGNAQPTLQFTEDGKINGSTGCNQYFASYDALADGKMSFSQVGATKMFCEGTMQVENAYLEALAQVTQFKTEQGKLILSSADGQTVLLFNMPPK